MHTLYASFNDLDGNGWLLQEITTQLPGRIDPAATTFRFGERSGERASAGGHQPHLRGFTSMTVIAKKR
jgi:hypothetical protein